MTLAEYIESIKNKKIFVAGIGVSNEPLIRLLCWAGCSVTAADEREIEQLGMKALELVNLGCRLKLGKDYLDDIDADIIFRTPGLMPFDERLQKAVSKGAELTSEMELFFRLCPCRTVAVTGSDGKTTTTSIIAEILSDAGYKVHVGGNIGKPLLCEVPMMKPGEICVLELSSFQLHSMECRPDVAVVTNVSPNHLDKHRDFEDYISAKKNIFTRQQDSETLVVNADDELCRGFAEEAKAKLRYFSGAGRVENGVYTENGTIYRAAAGEVRPIVNTDEILLPGRHNVLNFMAAFAATEGLADDECCAKAAREFKGVEHRLETVRIVGGVTYINDSIGTSPTRAIAGLNAMRTKPVIILGGHDKQVSFADLADELCLKAKKAILTGETADKIESAILASPEYAKNPLPYEKVPAFDEAVKAAADCAEEGDVVLLSPACSSFDAFKNFSERGRRFKEIVMEL